MGSAAAVDEYPHRRDDWLFGWDPLPGIVSVWADRDGRALIWQRTGEGVRCIEDRFRPWLFAASLDDLRHLGATLVEAGTRDADEAPFSYRELDGPPGSLRYPALRPRWARPAAGDPARRGRACGPVGPFRRCATCRGTTTRSARSSST